MNNLLYYFQTPKLRLYFEIAKIFCLNIILEYIFPKEQSILSLVLYLETLKYNTMKRIDFMQLPYPLEALEPHIVKLTIEFHYGKHHRTYFDNLHRLIIGTEFESMSLEEIVKKSNGAIFNNAAQVWNHNFYWNCMSPQNKNLPSDKLHSAIEKKFGSLEELKRLFKLAAMELFGSGWVWLVKNPNGELEIIQTSNAGNPICQDKTPLLVCDVWEHAYYLDKQNKRADYLEDFWELVDWQKVSARY
jgi:Fe-Mn family superoxide dismutase